MNLPKRKNQIESLVAYGTAPWQSALPTLRLVGPAERAGLKVTYGNDGPNVDTDKVAEADLVVIQRDFPRFALPFGEILQHARRQKKPVIYDVDDLLIDLPEGHLSYPDLSVMQPAMLWAMNEADAITVSTPYLQECLKFFNPNTWLLVNYLNDDLWTFSLPSRAVKDNEPVVIGYMGGKTHSPDLHYVLPALERILEVYSHRIRMRFWGGEPPRQMSDHPLVSWTPLDMQDYGEFARYFSAQSCDIFISPLANNRFNQAKSAIKFLEYSALGVPGVYSRMLPYESIIEDGENGLLASSMDEWVQCLSKLIEDPSLRHDLGESAQRTVRQGHLLTQHAGQWRVFYQQSRDLVYERDKAYYDRVAAYSRANHQVQERYFQLDREKVTFSEQLSLKSAELEEVYRSHTWQLLKRIQRVRRRLIPPGSWREKSLRKLGIF
jgi:glycosyltransferase involved in cell wall biosynthesis